MLEFICFGSGSSGNSCMISNGKDALFIDAGIGIRSLKKYLYQYGVDKLKVKGILITHDHADHICSAGLLSSYINTSVYVSPKIYSKIIMKNSRYRIDRNRLSIIETEKPIKFGDFDVTAFSIPHDATDNLGYSISFENEVFTLMTDIGKPTDDIKSYISRSNYLIIEADYDIDRLASNPRYNDFLKERITCGLGHLSNQQTSQLLFDNFHKDLAFIALCHLSEENNSPELAIQTVICKLKQKELIEGVDYKLEALNRKGISGPWKLSK